MEHDDTIAHSLQFYASPLVAMLEELYAKGTLSRGQFSTLVSTYGQEIQDALNRESRSQPYLWTACLEPLVMTGNATISGSSLPRLNNIFRVFNTAELLDAILFNLTNKDVRLTQRFCKGFQRYVQTAVSLQRNLFPIPDWSTDVVRYTEFMPGRYPTSNLWCDYGERYGGARGSDEPQHQFWIETQYLLGNRGPHSIETEPAADSLERGLISQPPPKCAMITVEPDITESDDIIFGPHIMNSRHPFYACRVKPMLIRNPEGPTYSYVRDTVRNLVELSGVLDLPDASKILSSGRLILTECQDLLFNHDDGSQTMGYWSCVESMPSSTRL